MKEITRKLIKYLFWMKPSKETYAARRGTEADPRNVKNGGRKGDDGVGLVTQAAVTSIATADTAPADFASTTIASADMRPAAIRLEGTGTAGSQEEAGVNDQRDNDLSNSRRSDAEDEAAILSRDFQKLNIGFPATRGAQPATPPDAPSRVPDVAVASDTCSRDGVDVKEVSKSRGCETETTSAMVADKDDEQKKDVDAEEGQGEDEDDDEEEAREFEATMLRLSLTVSKTEVDTILERGPTRCPGSMARDRGPYHDGAFQSRGLRRAEGGVLTEGHGHAVLLNCGPPYDLMYERFLVDMNVPLPNLSGDEVETYLDVLGGPKMTSGDVSRSNDGAESRFLSVPDCASDGYPSPQQFDLDSGDSNGSDCSTPFTEIGRTHLFKHRFRAQPSPDSMNSEPSPGSPWSTSTEGSSKSSTPPQMCRSDPPAQPPHYPLAEKTPPNFVDQVDRRYHMWIRSRFTGKAKLEGYGWDKVNKSPELITLLRDAEKMGRVDYQRIYECARGHMKYHIALLYEKDDHDKTALYYAARLHFDDRVAGFVAECLVEAQERCLKSNSGRRYRIDEELYGDDKDNIFHCLARWHKHGESYVAMAETLLSIPSLVTLLDRPNKAGLLPVDLCRHSDLRAMLDPRKRSFLLGVGASLLPVMPTAQVVLPPCFSHP